MITESIEIAAPPDRVFRAYVEEIDVWWPRQGTYRYSFAPADTAPASIHFEPGTGGRFLEIFADGSEYEIGRIERWDPPYRLTYSWTAPDWTQESRVDVTFTALPGGATRVEVTHTGLEARLEDGYAIGLTEILVAFAAAVGQENKP